MADENVHTGDAGADEAETLWNEFDKAEKPPDGGAAAEPAPEPADAPEAAPASPATPAAEPAPAATPAAAANDAASSNPSGAQTGSTDGAAPAAASTDDVWAKAPPELRAAHEATLNELRDTAQNYRRVSGTVSGLQRRINELTSKPAAGTPGKPAASASEQAGANAAEAKSILDDPEFKKAEEDFPEVLGPVKKALQAFETENRRLKTELGGVSARHREDNLVEQSKIVYQAHADYDYIAQTPSFRSWYENAPPYVKAAVERNADKIVDGAEVSHLVQQFKLETGYKPKARTATAAAPAAASPAAAAPAAGRPTPASPPNSRRQDQLASAAAPRATGPAANARSADPDDPEAIWKQFDEEERRAGQHR